MDAPEARKQKVLLIGMVNSIHVARWINLVKSTDTEMLIFPSTLPQEPHNLINELKSKPDLKVDVHQVSSVLWKILYVLDLVLGNRIRGMYLQREIERFDPDIIHVLEFQHAGYLLLRVKQKYLTGREVIATNYGSDIYWFSRFPSHARRIRKLLQVATAYSAECKRDIGLAKKFGFNGRVLLVIPNSGGFDHDFLNQKEIALADRKLILVKGYNGWSGQAGLVIRALWGMKSELIGFSIVFYSSNLSTIILASVLRIVKRLDVRIYKKGALTHQEMLELMRYARLYVGVARTDGISTSLLESIAGGAFPIQSVTACADEWITHKKSGYMLKVNNPKEIQIAIRWSLEYSEDVPQRTWESIRIMKKLALQQNKIQEVAKRFYVIGHQPLAESTS